MQISATIRYHLTPVKIAIIRKWEINSIGKDTKKRKPLCTVDGNANWYSHYGKEYEGSLKQLKMQLLYDPADPLLGIHPKEMNS